jgi:microcystin-dependent protein
VAYNSITPPYGWALCDGLGGRPNLINRFILGGGGTRNIGFTGGAEEVTLTVDNLPRHSHYYTLNYPSTANRYNAKASGGGTAYYNGGFYNGNTGATGDNVPHENMPPYYVLVYIIKTQDYDFSYNLVT